MSRKLKLRFWILGLLAVLFISAKAQTVPVGINYQAVARDNSGKELSNEVIQVKFSILSGSGVGEVAYQELHANVRTSNYGVFTLILGEGDRLGGTAEGLAGIPWENANHFLKVEIDFGQGFVNMGTMQFFAVPYALYAKRSLEPGPQGPKGDQGQQGPKGDPGDPATNNQRLSFDGTNLSITPNGNMVNLSTLNIPHSLSILGDTLSILGGNKVGLPNQIQDLTLDGSNILKITKNTSATSIDLNKFLDDKDQQTLGFNTGTNFLSILNGNSVDLTPMKQDLSLTGNTLTITNKLLPASIDLSKYLQSLSLNTTTNKLSISNVAGDVDLNKFLDNTDAQTVSYDSTNYKLSISNGNSVKIGRIIAFRASVNSALNLANNVASDLIFDQITGTGQFNDGGGYSTTTGVFQAPIDGIYTFSISINLPIGSSSILVKLNGSPYETIIGPTSAGGYFRATITMKLVRTDIVNAAVLQTNGFAISPYIISGTFSGFRIY